MSHGFAVAGHWKGEFDEAGLQRWAEQLRAGLNGKPSLGLIFMTPRFFPQAKQVLEIVRVHAQVPLLVGCSSQALINGSEEIEDGGGISLAIFHLPRADLKVFHFKQEHVDECNGPAYWRHETGLDPAQTNGWPAGIPTQAYPGAVLQGNMQYMGLEKNEPWRFRPIEESDIKIIQDEKVLQVEDMQVEGTVIKVKPKYQRR